MENESFVMQENAKSAEALKAGKGEPQGKPFERRVAKSIPIVGTAKVSYSVWRAKDYTLKTYRKGRTARCS